MRLAAEARARLEDGPRRLEERGRGRAAQHGGQAGADTDSPLFESGGQFRDDPGGLALKHNRTGLLSMANAGPDTNDSHFSIMAAPAPHLDGHYTIFGECVEGCEAIELINALARDKPDKTATAADGAVITDTGQLREGAYKPDLRQMLL